MTGTDFIIGSFFVIIAELHRGNYSEKFFERKSMKSRYGIAVMGIIGIIIAIIVSYKINLSFTTVETENTEEEVYTITQYGDYNGNQSMFYTIESKAGELVVIDGGYDTDADRVKEVIEKYNNHINAWIITHPHPDHAGAYNAIFSEANDIIVDDIYTVYVNYDRYQETAEDYDRFDVYEKFLSLTQDKENLHYVRENDEFEKIGLRFKVLHAWDEDVDELDSNLCNNGSMMFVVSGKEEKMLFCADVEDEMQDIILERHLEDLQVDYIQLGHHGNWGPDVKFYENMKPRAVFFDAPGWLVENTEGVYDAFSLKEYFERNEVEVKRFSDDIQRVYLR